MRIKTNADRTSILTTKHRNLARVCVCVFVFCALIQAVAADERPPSSSNDAREDVDPRLEALSDRFAEIHGLYEQLLTEYEETLRFSASVKERMAAEEEQARTVTRRFRAMEEGAMMCGLAGADREREDLPNSFRGAKSH